MGGHVIWVQEIQGLLVIGTILKGNPSIVLVASYGKEENQCIMLMLTAQHSFLWKIVIKAVTACVDKPAVSPSYFRGA